MTGSLTIIIPAFNESKRISNSLKDIDEYISRKSKAGIFYVIVVDDGSIDDTASMVKKHFPTVQLIKKKHTGKSASLNAGIARAKGELIAVIDGDIQIEGS